MHKDEILAQSWVIPSTGAEAARICDLLLDHARDRGFGQEDLFAIHLALEEAFLNAVQHGNASDPNKTVSIECLLTPEKFDISIADQGGGFDPGVIPDCRCGPNLYKTNGRGILLINSYMDIVEFNDSGNCIHLVKFRGKTSPRRHG